MTFVIFHLHFNLSFVIFSSASSAAFRLKKNIIVSSPTKIIEKQKLISSSSANYAARTDCIGRTC